VLTVQGAGSPSPLIGQPGILVTPHMAALSMEASQRVALSAAHSTLAVLRGERPPHVVNPEAFAAS
jgi:D-3-phosphoglycerate dehydrogenase